MFIQCHNIQELLHTEAKLVDITSQLVYREDVTRMQRNGARTTTVRLLSLWEEYRSNQRSATNLLAAGSRLICPRLDPVEP